MGAAVAVMIMRERRIVEAYERAGATSPERGRSPHDVGVDHQGRAWRRLLDHAIIRESPRGSGEYYADVEVWQALRRIRRRVALVMLFIAIAVGGVVFVTSLNAGP